MPSTALAVTSPTSNGTALAPEGSAARLVATEEAARIARLEADASAAPVDVRMAPSARGALGAWLVAGPFQANRPALDADPSGIHEPDFVVSSGGVASADRERSTQGRPGRKASGTRWGIASSSAGPIDLKTALESTSGDVIAYAGGTLHVERSGHYVLLLSVDDGVRVTLDGRVMFSRDVARPLREDDDVIPLDLSAGDHTVLLKLHQRDSAWAFRARFVDATLGPPAGSYLRLPGTTVDDAYGLAVKMAAVSFKRAFDAKVDPPRYRPKLTVTYPEGAPRGVAVAVRARLVGSNSEAPVFDVDAGSLLATSAGPSELLVALPDVSAFAASRTLETLVEGRVVKNAFPSRPAAEQAVAHAARALTGVATDAPFLAEGSLDSVRYLTRRLEGLLDRGDTDVEAQTEEARELDRMAFSLETRVDPFEGRTGATRRALRSSLDGDFSELGVYVPPGYRTGAAKTYPLVVGLHGLNGYAMGVMRWLFGFDDPKRDQAWEDRHVGSLPPIDAFVITPLGHGNALYRELGEVDVMHAVEWAQRRYPIDASRVTITGMSMGGIGAASLPLHRPHVFAGSEPLCGYHSTLMRSDVAGRALRPWERYLAEERSNVMWAENGEHLPLFVVHGTQDLPEENSGVLIDRYEKLQFSVKHEHPESGHNVWQQTYEDLKGLTWLMNRRLERHPSHVRLKTSRTRWGKSAWVAIDELASESAWAEVDLRANPKTHRVTGSTRGVSQLTLTRDETLFGNAAVDLTIDGQPLTFEEGEALVVGREATNGSRETRSEWHKGPLAHAGIFKHGNVTGPLRDAFSEPLLFVYGDSEPAEARANEQVALAFAKIRQGVQVAYPILSDSAFLAKNEPLANERALFLVGRTNRVLAKLAEVRPFSIRVEEGAVTVGNERFTGKELGAAFIYPNPARPDRYVVVVAGADAAGTLRAMSLPDLLPDFAVWDEAVAPSRGQIVLGAGSLRAAGFFTKTWELPSKTFDPYAKRSHVPDAPVPIFAGVASESH